MDDSLRSFLLRFGGMPVRRLLDSIREAPVHSSYVTEPIGVIIGCQYYFDNNVRMVIWVSPPIVVDSLDHVIRWSQDDFKARKIIGIDIEECEEPYRREKIF